MKIGSSHLLDNLSNCLMDLKNSGHSAGFEPMRSYLHLNIRMRTITNGAGSIKHTGIFLRNTDTLGVSGLKSINDLRSL